MKAVTSESRVLITRKIYFLSSSIRMNKNHKRKANMLPREITKEFLNINHIMRNYSKE